MGLGHGPLGSEILYPLQETGVWDTLTGPHREVLGNAGHGSHGDPPHDHDWGALSN